MKRMFVAIASFGAILGTSNATSLMDRDPDAISDSLAKARGRGILLCR
ncbi:hypothetical protein ABFT80_14640 [Mesorhizobium sp. SB112]